MSRLLTALILFLTQPALSAELQWHGFADIVAAQTNTQDFLNDLNNHEEELGIDPESRLGLNLIADLADDFTFAAQILARGSNNGAYTLAADWVFATYRPSDTYSFRIGRQNNPAFLYSEQLDVGYTYLWVRLPADIYGYYPVKAMNGLSLLYDLPIGDNNNLQIQIFGGSGDTSFTTNSLVLEAQSHRIRGAEISWTTDTSKLRGAYIANNPIATLDVGSGPVLADFGTFEVTAIGGYANFGKFILTSEASHIVSEGAVLKKVHAVYASLGYQVTSALTPYVMYSTARDFEGQLFITPGPPMKVKENQHSYMIGVNYKINPSVVLKAEYMNYQEKFTGSGGENTAEAASASMDMIF